MSIRKIGALLAAAVVALTGAYGALAQQPDRFEAVYDANGTQILFDAEVDRPDATDAQALRVRRLAWPVRLLEDVFFDGRDTGLQIDNGYIEHDGANGERLEIFEGVLSYRAGALDIEYGLGLYAWDEEGRDERGELAGYPLEDAYAQVRTLCERLGLTPGEIVRYTAMDEARREECFELRQKRVRDRYNLLERIGMALTDEEVLTREALASWQEGYLMYVVFAYEGLSCIRQPNDMNTFGDYPRGSGAQFFVTQADGVLYMEHDVYSTSYEVLEAMPPGTKQSIPMEQAAEAVVKKFSQLILKAPVTIGRVAYEYVPVPAKKQRGQYTLQPAWCFYPVTPEGVTSLDDAYQNPIFINAFNGKEIQNG